MRHHGLETERLQDTLGAPPGTLTTHSLAKAPIIRIFAYGPEGFVEEEFADIESMPDYIEKWPVTWLNVDGLGDVDTIRRLGELFSLHGLALEDVLSLHQRPKVEEYGGHLFLVVRMLREGFPIETEQLSMFVGSNFVLTFQENAGNCLDPVRKRIREGLGRVRAMGPDYLAYSIIDAVIDAYFPHLDEISDRMEDLEAEVLARPSNKTIAKIHLIKRDLLMIRRIIVPTREIINSLLRDDAKAITSVTRTHLRDCYDHAVHLLDLVETYREVSAGLLDVYLSSVSNRMNEVMKVLTIIATLFIPLTFIAGVYGMNFDPDTSPFNMPELRAYWGYPVLLVSMGAIAALQLFFFWRRGWLSKPNPADDNHDDQTHDT